MKPIAAMFVFLLLFLGSPAHGFDLKSPAVHRFINRMVVQYHFRRGDLERLLAQVKTNPQIIAAINHPAEALPWRRYRKIFLTPGRIQAGRRFLLAHQRLLSEAQNHYGVPAPIIVAILGMETRYGVRQGRHSALQALATLAFAYPPRARFFSKQLAAFLILCRKNNLNPLTVQSSYAGALGAGQFMPSSYLAYAVDTSGKGSNLFTSWPDIIASIANFLAAHGWQRGRPIAVPAGSPSGEVAADLLNRMFPVRKLRARGIIFDAPVSANTSVQLFAVGATQGRHYWVGLPNFTVLMRYNRSPLYALAATQLAAALVAPPVSTSSGEALASAYH